MLASLTLEVIDPVNRTGKISVPMHHVHETRGVHDHQRNPDKRDVKDLSLCLLFQKGRCNAGTRCHQVHVDPAFVQRLRTQAAANRNCCARHGDAHSLGYLQSELSELTVTSPEGPVVYAMQDFGRTALLDQMLRRGVKSIPSNKICRLHSQGRCKFGKDCKNVHLCHQATPLAKQADAPAKHATPVKSALGESCSLGGSAVKDACGLSCTSYSSKSSGTESPLEKTMQPLSVNEVSARSDSGFSLFSQPMNSGKVPSPQFDATGFEATMSLVQMDLWRVECEKSGSPEWKPW